MATATAHRTLSSPQRQAVVTMYVGLALSVIATVIVPLLVALATSSYTDYIKTAYPTYDADKVSNYQQMMLMYLVANGVIGAVTWLWVLRRTKKQKAATFTVASIVFVLALSLALFNYLVKDSTGYAALSPLLGIANLVPCVAGLAAIVMLWRGRAADRS
ncbi:hypothetical protein ACWD6P_07900 [Streptomyces sp. NPDC002446]